jgi:uncharacterized damage-inducible protein DinB
MSRLEQQLLESWDRQTQILSNLASQIDETNRRAKPSPDGWGIDTHLGHIHEVRYWWLSKVAPELAKDLGDGLEEQGDEWLAIENLAEIKRLLEESGLAVRKAVADALESGTEKFGPYDHPVLFLQHMIWHEGYHFGLINLALRNIGAEPSEEWAEENVWGLWRTEE